MTLSDKLSLVCIVALSLLCLSLCQNIKQQRDQISICEEHLRRERGYSEMIFRAFQQNNEKLMTCETK